MRFLFFTSVLLSLLLNNSCSSRSHRFRAIKDLEYASYQHQGTTKSLLLDLYIPSSRSHKPLPLLIYIHGGGWREFSKEKCPGEIVAKRGWAIACINYRYSTEAIFPAQIHDAKGAVRWLRANAAKYNLNPDKFGAWGASAGGHLSLLLGTSEGEESLEGNWGNLDYSSGVRAVCNWFAPTDFTLVEPAFTEKVSPQVRQKYRERPWYLYTVVTSLLLGGSVTEKAELAQSANPISYLDPQDPPVMVVHGDADKIVPVSQSDLLVSALQKNEVPVTYLRKKNMIHSYKGANGEHFDPKLIDSALDFFEDVLHK